MFKVGDEVRILHPLEEGAIGIIVHVDDRNKRFPYRVEYKPIKFLGLERKTSIFKESELVFSKNGVSLMIEVL